MDNTNPENFTCTPPSIVEDAHEAALELLSTTSKLKYEQIYNRFMKWKMENNASSFSENVMLAYFEMLKNKFKPSTLWSNYSILHSTISVKHSVDISKYSKLHALLKKESSGYQPKKSKTLTSAEIYRFLKEAPDNEFLMIKVALGIGIMGACRREELCNLKIDNVEDLGNAMLVKIPNTKTKIPRAFTLIGTMYDLCKKYISLRPSNMNNNRFFLKYTSGQCIRQVVGINTFGAIPKKIAIFLNLNNPELYTGHTFRRSSATLLVDAGGDLLSLKRHGGWKSSSTAEGYIDDSMSHKLDTAQKILQSVENNNISSQRQSITIQSSSHNDISSSSNNPSFVFNNCTVSINYAKES